MAPLSTTYKVICRSGGALYAAFDNAKRTSRHCGSYTKAKYLEQAYSDSRTITHNDVNESKIASKTFDVRNCTKE